MRWVDTEVTLFRSVAHSRTWVGNVPGGQIRDLIDTAGPVRICQQHTRAQAIAYGHVADDDRLRWHHDADADVFILQRWEV